MPQYSYRRLPDDANYIRLLQLMPNDNESTTGTRLNCRLFDYSLQDTCKGTHPYEALSYTWDGVEKPCSIFIEGKESNVTANLHAALSSLRHRSLTRILWVDALCINQNDNDERSQQVRLMAMIYSKAYCVIVWLGEIADDVDGALEYIQYAANKEFIQRSDENSEEKVVSNLLQRQWFQRVWVLQEVAAARHVVIKCGSTEIDGYAFCLGLQSMRQSQQLSFTASSTLHNLRSLTNLIEQAGLRPKHTTISQKRYYLKIRSLAELVDMFHTRQATDPRDKVYALLGMSFGYPSEAGIQPNYEMFWEDLVQRLVKFILGQDILVEISDQRVLIRVKGYILGRVSQINNDKGQTVTIESTNSAWSSEEWSLQASAIPVRQGDIVCLLKGAPKPTIIRLCGCHFAVIVFAATPLNNDGTSVHLSPLKSTTHFSRDFLLVWDWEDHLGDAQNQECIENWIENIRVHKHLKTELGDDMDRATSIWNIALVLGDLKEYRKAQVMLEEAIECYEISKGRRRKYMLKGRYGLTPLSWVAETGYDPAVKLLLAKDGIDPDLQDSQYGRTPLLWAVHGGHEAVIKLLLETGKVDVDTRDNNGRSPLIEAVQKRHEIIFKLLLETNKVDVDARDNNGRSPLMEAVQKGHENIFNLLLETNEVDVDARDNNGRSPLMEAVQKGHEIIFNLLLETSKVDFDARDNFGRTPLLEAIHGRHEVIFKLLLETGNVDVDVKDSLGWTPLLWAVHRGYETIVKLLLETSKVDVDISQKALNIAARDGHLAIVEQLLQEKTDVYVSAKAYRSKHSALQVAAEGGYLAIVERLIQEKANVNSSATMVSNRTALQGAAERGHLAIVERLIQEKADVNAPAAAPMGRTALQAAAGGGYLAIVERLIQEKADVNAPAATSGGLTALQAAAEGGHLAVVERLLQEKADVNASAASLLGQTALEAAIGGSHHDIVNLLRKAGAIEYFSDSSEDD